MFLRSFLALFLGSMLCSAPLIVAAADRPLTNADVVNMTQSHFSDSTLIAVIQTHKSAFDLSADGLMALRKAGVSDPVIHAMIDATNAQTQAATTQAQQNGSAAPSTGQPSGGVPPNLPDTSQMPPQVQAIMQSMGMGGAQTGAPVKLPDVWMVNAQQQKAAMKYTTATTVQNQMQGMGGGGASGMLGGLAQQGLGLAGMALGPIGGIASGLFGMFSHPKAPPKPHMHMVWALPNPSSQNVLQNASPSFELSYGDIPGIDPDSFEATIVKLEQTKDNWRLIGATDQEISAETYMGGGPPPADSIVENRIPVIIKEVARGHVQITPEKPLDPGEYGVVLRPDKEADKSHDLGGPAQTQLFYTVWDFSVAGTPQAAPPAPAPSATPN